MLFAVRINLSPDTLPRASRRATSPNPTTRHQLLLATEMASLASLSSSLSFHTLRRPIKPSISASRISLRKSQIRSLIPKSVATIASRGESGDRIRSSATGKMAGEKSGDRKVEVFDSEEEVAVELAKYTAALSEKFVKERGAFTCVVSGGSLIKSLRKLTEAPYVEEVDWSKWHVFWVDERVVPKDDPDSNYKLAYDGFLSKVKIPPGQVYAINDALPAEAAADDYETCIKHLVTNGVISVSAATGFPKFDVMLLGMGPDGHIASLFPGHPLVQESKKWVTFIKDSPKPPPDRITFTLPVINSSAHIALVVCGSGKAGPVQAALRTGNPASEVLPVQLVSPEGEFTWFLDKGAASKL